MEALTVPLIGVAISLATFVYTLVVSARKAEADKVERLERQLDAVEVRLTDCENDRHDLREQVLNLKATVLSKDPTYRDCD